MKTLLAAARGFVFFLLLGATAYAQATPKALPPLQVPPAQMPPDPKLSPLLTTENGTTITNRSGWELRRSQLKGKWLQVLGTLPAPGSPLHAKVLHSETLPEYTRQKVEYEVEPGIPVQGYLFTPKGPSGKRPAIVVFHPTTAIRSKGVAGLDPSYAQEKWQGVQLVQRGYVVWCPDNYIEGGNQITWTASAKAVIAKHPDWTGMTRMVSDAIRAADYVSALPNVDPERIGCIGHSLGGKEALYAPAFDSRYKVAVSCEGGIGLKLSNWNAIWYFGKKIDQPAFKLENHQILALIAPRPFLLLAGDSADGSKSWPFIAAVQPVYDLLGASGNIGWFDHHLGHRYAPEARAVAEAFLDKYLQP